MYSQRTQNFLNGDNSHMDYKDQLRTYNVKELLDEIEVNAQNAKYKMRNKEDYEDEVMAVLDAAKQLKQKIQMGSSSYMAGGEMQGGEMQGGGPKGHVKVMRKDGTYYFRKKRSIKRRSTKRK